MKACLANIPFRSNTKALLLVMSTHRRRTTPLRFLGLFAAGILFAICCFRPVPILASDLSAAKVVGLKGHARALMGTNTAWVDLARGQTLTLPCTIETAAESYVDVLLGKALPARTMSPKQAAEAGNPSSPPLIYSPAEAAQKLGTEELKKLSNYVRLPENSRLQILSAMAAGSGLTNTGMGDIKFELQAGSVFISLANVPTDSTYEILTPSFSMKAQQGIYDLQFPLVKVLFGWAWVSYQEGKSSQVILSRQAFDTRSGTLSNF